MKIPVNIEPFYCIVTRYSTHACAFCLRYRSYTFNDDKFSLPDKTNDNKNTGSPLTKCLIYFIMIQRSDTPKRFLIYTYIFRFR